MMSRYHIITYGACKIFSAADQRVCALCAVSMSRVIVSLSPINKAVLVSLSQSTRCSDSEQKVSPDPFISV